MEQESLQDAMSVQAEQCKVSRDMQQDEMTVQATQFTAEKDSLERQSQLMKQCLGESKSMVQALRKGKQTPALQTRLLHETGLLVTAVESLIETRHAEELALLC